MARKTVVLQPLPGIGDMIWHLPALRAIAAASAGGRIDLVTNGKLPAEALLGNEGIIDRYLAIPKPRSVGQRLAATYSLIRQLRRGRYERIVILHRSPRYALAARLAGIRVIHGYGFGKQKFLLTQGAALAPGDDKIFPMYRAANLLKLMGMTADLRQFHLTPRPEAVRAVADAFAAMPKPWAGFGIGATEPYRRWAPERFAAVADRLWAAGYRSIFLLGASHEAGIAQDIIVHCKVAKPVAVTDRPLDQVIGLISQCAFFFCNDSGLMNVALALGLPVYALVAHVVPYDFAANLHHIVPADGHDSVLGVEKLSVAQAEDVLTKNGIFSANRS